MAVIPEPPSSTPAFDPRADAHKSPQAFTGSGARNLWGADRAFKRVRDQGMDPNVERVRRALSPISFGDIPLSARIEEVPDAPSGNDEPPSKRPCLTDRIEAECSQWGNLSID